MKEPIVIVHEVSVEHTDEQPYCDDPACDCHCLLDNLESYDRYIEQPLQAGLLTTDEAHRIYWNKQV